jgi:hypothetical protein
MELSFTTNICPEGLIFYYTTQHYRRTPQRKYTFRKMTKTHFQDVLHFGPYLNEVKGSGISLSLSL